MPEKPLPFVITDRRKFTPEGEARTDAPATPPAPETQPKPPEKPQPIPQPDPENVNITPGSNEPEIAGAPRLDSETWDDPAQAHPEEEIPAAPTAEQMEQSRLAFNATAERLDLAIRAANPGVDHAPPMTFDQLVQSIYMQAIMQLGGGTQQGQQPQVDILGARQSIDMLSILADKTTGNLSEPEQTLLSSALFELRLGFLEITQALARSAQQRAAASAPAPPAGGPRIVR